MDDTHRDAPAAPPTRRIPRDLDHDLRETAVRLTGELGEIVTPGKLLALSARRGLPTITADDLRARKKANAR